MDIIIAIILITAIGILCGVMLVLASYFMSVQKDETEEKIRACLPGANCGACGYAGCDEYAKDLAQDNTVKSNLCVPGADKVAKEVAEVLGVEAEDVIEQVAFIHCFGDCTRQKNKHIYEGISSCAASNMLYSGDGSCIHGCLGYGDCAKVCPEGAICIENGIAHIDQRKCIGCGLCAKACPNHLISLFADVDKIAITCSNKEKGAVARKQCTNACIKCKKCEKNCPTGAIKIIDNLPVIDYSKCTACKSCVQGCPVGCIIEADFSGSHRNNE